MNLKHNKKNDVLISILQAAKQNERVWTETNPGLHWIGVQGSCGKAAILFVRELQSERKYKSSFLFSRSTIPTPKVIKLGSRTCIFGERLEK